jgi:hypothetical protein
MRRTMPERPHRNIPSEHGPTGFELLVYESDDAFCNRLAGLHPELMSLLAEHRRDNGEILPHVFMADVEGWFEQKVRAGERAAMALTVWLEAEYPSASPSIENVICVSFLEALPLPPDSEVEAISGMLGPRLRRSLTKDAAPGA